MKLQPIDALHLSIRPATNGLPTQSPESLAQWTSNKAKQEFASAPPPPPPKLPPTVMDIVLAHQGKG